ncbi:MAG: hypothetical protein BJ554DRAFT_5527 [Olpidium bornovanus]|uniref:Uncharacterized protein n=1 Tax=Olpidium bornovanus TaxID=278681 RepID=A0A8H8DKS3_9FUNG|nr:MAG: hypothetical protein BJ554DRAFT_5527 [Olpidium bornovanus]
MVLLMALHPSPMVFKFSDAEKRNILVSLSGSTSDEIYPQIEAEIVKRLLPSSATHRTGQSFADDPTAFPGPAPLPGPSAVADGVTASVSVVQLA